MKKPKHTPGPWHCNRLIDNNGKAYATNYTAHIDIGVCMVWAPEGNDEQEANARLIAAAPELLEALEESRDFIVDHCEDMSRIYSKWELIDKIKSAIAKAKP